MDGQPVIRVRDLVKRYDEITALGGVSFDVHAGEILGLLGPNGAGKSTALKILTSYVSATSGQVTVDGVDLFENPVAVRAMLGYLPESTPLYGDMLVYDYLRYCGEIRGFDRATCHTRIAEVTRTVGIADRIGSPISTLSKGLKQRVGLAQALLHNPRILILDEPTSGLDPNQIVEIRSLIRELGKTHTVILSTHILPEARQTCDRIVIIHKGLIVADGTAEQLEGRVQARPHVVIGVAGRREDAAGLEAELRALPEVEQVTLGHHEDKPVPYTTWEILAGRDLRPELARWASDKGRDLVELRRKSMDLESIFQSLTHDA